MHCGGVTPAFSMKSADGVPLEIVLTLGCYGCEGGVEVKEMMGEPFTSKMVALVDLIGNYQVFRPKAEGGFTDLRFRQRRVLIELRLNI